MRKCVAIALTIVVNLRAALGLRNTGKVLLLLSLALGALGPPAHDALAVGAATADAAARRLRNTIGDRAVIPLLIILRRLLCYSNMGAAAY